MKTALITLLLAGVAIGEGRGATREEPRGARSDQAPPSQAPQVIDRIMAVVGAQPITLSDVLAALQFRLVEPPAGTADRRAYAVERLIERTLMLAEVERFQPPEPDPIEMTLRIDALERGVGSPAAFDKELGVFGLTRDQLRRHIRDDLRITTYLNQRFGATAAQPERQAIIASWIVELRKRADVTILSARPGGG